MNRAVVKSVREARSRLLARRALALGSAVMPTALAASLIILVSIRDSAPQAPHAVLAAVSGVAVALIALLTWWSRPDDADAARALDRISGGGDVFLTAVSPRLADADVFSRVFSRAAARAAEKTSARAAVGLPRPHGLVFAVVLMFANGLLVAMPRAGNEARAVTEVGALVSRSIDAAPASERLKRLGDDVASARDEAALREVLDRHWRERRRERVDALLAAMADALRRGDETALVESSKRAARLDLGVASAAALADLADAVAIAAERGDDRAKELLEEAGRLEQGDAAAAGGIAGALGGAAPGDPVPAPPETYDAVEELLIAAYSSLGTGPPGAGAGRDEAEPARLPASPGDLDDAGLTRFSPEDRELLGRYLERRAARRGR